MNFFRCSPCGVEVPASELDKTMRHRCGHRVEPIAENWETASRHAAKRFYLGAAFLLTLLGLCIGAILINSKL